MTEKLFGVPSGAIAIMAWGWACARAYGDTGALPTSFLKSRSQMRRAGTEGIETIMWLMMRGALQSNVKVVHKHYHAPTVGEVVTHWGANDYYYAIIDCITHGHRWEQEKEFASCQRCHTVKAMCDFKPGEYHCGR